MKNDFNKLSEIDLENVIANAGKELQVRKTLKRKEIIAKIKELAASIDVNVEITGAKKKSGRRGQKVPAKYQNPNNPSQQWSGRGMKPNWMKALLDKGQKIEKFAIKGK